MSLSSKITDDEMRYFQFKAGQMFLLHKEDLEWKAFCKRNTCTCCSCRTSTVTKMSKEVGVQSSPKKTLHTSGSNLSLHPSNRNLPQTLNTIKSKLEKIDLTLSEMNVFTKSEKKEQTVPKEIVNQQMNTLKFPIESDVTESVKSVINDRRMQLIQNSLKMSLQRLQSAALKNTKSNFEVKVKKKNSGYFIPRDLEKRRAAARQAYLASLVKPPAASKILPNVASGKRSAEKGSFKPKSLKVITKPNLQKFNVSNNKKEEVTTLVSSEKDEDTEIAIDGILDDLLDETSLIINNIRHSKSKKSSAVIQNTKIPNHFAKPLDSEEHEAAINEQAQNKLEKTRQNSCSIMTKTEPKADKHEPTGTKDVTVIKNATDSEQFCSSSGISTHPKRGIADFQKIQPLRELVMDPTQAKQITKSRKEYWSYLERISRTKKGNFDPWMLSNMVAESLLDDGIKEISEELQDLSPYLIEDLYVYEFLQSI